MDSMQPGMDMAPQAGGHNQSSVGEMHMTMYWGEVVTLIFQGWSSGTMVQYLFSLLALFVLAFFHQALAYLRTLLLDPNKITNQKGITVFVKRPMLISILETLGFAVHAATGYLLMLAVMSYNVGVFVVILGGLSVGFFFFCAWRKASPDRPVDPAVAGA